MANIIDKYLTKTTKSITVITLLAFLSAFFLHSQHLTLPQIEQSTLVDSQDCNFCQQGVDSAPKSLAFTAIIKGSFTRLISYFVALVDSVKTHFSPPPRAPPRSF